MILREECQALTGACTLCQYRNLQQTKAQVRRVTSATATLLASPFRKTPLRDDAAPPKPRAARPDTSPPPAAGFSFWGASASSRRKRLQELEEEKKRRALLGLPVEREPELESLTPLHLRTPPPDPWTLGRQLHTSEVGAGMDPRCCSHMHGRGPCAHAVPMYGHHCCVTLCAHTGMLMPSYCLSSPCPRMWQAGEALFL